MSVRLNETGGKVMTMKGRWTSVRLVPEEVWRIGGIGRVAAAELNKRGLTPQNGGMIVASADGTTELVFYEEGD